MSATASHPPHPHHYSLAEYHRMGDAGIFTPNARVELIQGEIVDMTPIGSGHAGIVNRLNSILGQKGGDSVIVSNQNPVVLNDFSEPQPDLALLRYREDFYSKSHPCAEDVLLLVEVADTTLQYDREIKLPLYAGADIPEVWLVDVQGKSIEFYSRPEEERYAMQQSPDDLKNVKIAALTGISFDLSELFET